MEAVSGVCDPKFDEVREALARNISSGEEVGASISVIVDGTNVVDIWGGWSDAVRGLSWDADTITNVWSTTKTVTALAALMLVDRGLLDPYSPVSKYWPEFAQNGKETVDVRHVLAHTSGVAGWEKPLSLGQLYDHGFSCGMLAEQATWWVPGTAAGYHGISYGHLLGELVRRVDGRTLGRFIADEIANPLRADFQIGALPTDYHRISDVIPPPPLTAEAGSAPLPELMTKALANPLMDASVSYTDEWRRAEFGAGNGFTNARALARIHSAVACGGAFEGVRLLSPDTIDLIFDKQSDSTDLVLGVPVSWGVGYALPNPESTPYLPAGRLGFWFGWGGSQLIVDVDRHTTIAYTMNKMGSGLMGTPRSIEYTRAIYDALH